MNTQLFLNQALFAYISICVCMCVNVSSPDQINYEGDLKFATHIALEHLKPVFVSFPEKETQSDYRCPGKNPSH